MDLFNNKGAEFSDDRQYRYVLWRIWDSKKPFIMFIGLNPSTADEINDDPTIRKVKKFAYNWNYGGVYMMNLFAFITPYPKYLEICNDPIGENDKWLNKISERCEKIVFAWGNFSEANKRAEQIIDKFEGYVLGFNKNGSPKHPLYIPYNTKLIKFN